MKRISIESNLSLAQYITQALALSHNATSRYRQARVFGDMLADFIDRRLQMVPADPDATPKPISVLEVNCGAISHELEVFKALSHRIKTGKLNANGFTYEALIPLDSKATVNEKGKVVQEPASIGAFVELLNKRTLSQIALSPEGATKEERQQAMSTYLNLLSNPSPDNHNLRMPDQQFDVVVVFDGGLSKFLAQSDAGTIFTYGNISAMLRSCVAQDGIILVFGSSGPIGNSVEEDVDYERYTSTIDAGTHSYYLDLLNGHRAIDIAEHNVLGRTTKMQDVEFSARSQYDRNTHRLVTNFSDIKITQVSPKDGKLSTATDESFNTAYFVPNMEMLNSFLLHSHLTEAGNRELSMQSYRYAAHGPLHKSEGHYAAPYGLMPGAAPQQIAEVLIYTKPEYIEAYEDSLEVQFARLGLTFTDEMVPAYGTSANTAGESQSNSDTITGADILFDVEIETPFTNSGEDANGNEEENQGGPGQEDDEVEDDLEDDDQGQVGQEDRSQAG